MVHDGKSGEALGVLRKAHDGTLDLEVLEEENRRRVERQTGGEVLRAEPMQRDGREVYRLKVLTSDGRVRVMQEDPSEPPAGDRPARQRDRDQERPKKSKDASEGSDADPPL